MSMKMVQALIVIMMCLWLMARGKSDSHVPGGYNWTIESLYLEIFIKHNAYTAQKKGTILIEDGNFDDL